jgi:hypothetical protein
MFPVLQEVLLAGSEEPQLGSAIEAVWLDKRLSHYLTLSAEAWSAKMEAVKHALGLLKEELWQMQVSAGSRD